MNIISLVAEWIYLIVLFNNNNKYNNIKINISLYKNKKI